MNSGEDRRLGVWEFKEECAWRRVVVVLGVEGYREEFFGDGNIEVIGWFW